MKNPLQMAEYVISMTAELHNLGLRMIQDSLEAMDQILQDSPIRLKHWIVESHTTKQLVTSLGTVTFRKTLFTNKETGTSEYNTQDIFGAIKCHTKNHIGSTIEDPTIFTNLIVDRIHKNKGINRLQRTRLPFLLHYDYTRKLQALPAICIPGV